MVKKEIKVMFSGVSMHYPLRVIKGVAAHFTGAAFPFLLLLRF